MTRAEKTAAAIAGAAVVALGGVTARFVLTSAAPSVVPSIPPELPRVIMWIPPVEPPLDSGGITFGGPCFMQSYRVRIVAQPESLDVIHEALQGQRPAPGATINYGHFGAVYQGKCLGLVREASTSNPSALGLPVTGSPVARPRWVTYDFTGTAFQIGPPANTSDGAYGTVWSALMALWARRPKQLT